MKPYLSTSEIAKLFKLNRQTLHFYDKKGLFVPEYRDSETGYRKYSFDQVANLALICYLRRIGFSIEQIKVIMNLGNIDLIMNQFKDQSEMLKTQYNEILKTDNVIQRKIKFVEDKLENLDIKKIEVKTYPKRAYIFLGQEVILYMNEAFYFFPTIAFYHYDRDSKHYERTFGAYIGPEISIEEYKGNIEYIDENQFLCFYHRGPYKEIPSRVASLREKYKGLKLSPDLFCINIVDQFLEKRTENFITEIQIPILN